MINEVQVRVSIVTFFWIAIVCFILELLELGLLTHLECQVVAFSEQCEAKLLNIVLLIYIVVYWNACYWQLQE